MALMEELGCTVRPVDTAAMEKCRARWASIAKPLGSLGRLEDAVIKIAGLTGDAGYRPEKRAAIVFCADNGVVAQGVTQTGSEVTAVVAKNITRGAASVCRMAEVARADVIAVDMGMNVDMQLPELLGRRVAAGTGDISLGPAMTRRQAVQAIQAGLDLAGEMKARGYRILMSGEMGIGNTTTSSAVAAVLLGKDPAEVTGRGAGLSSEGLTRKTEAIRRAIAVNRPDANDPVGVLAHVGGFDLAGMCGMFIGGAVHGIPVIADGFISCTAALAAVRICPGSAAAILASHVSAEPAGQMLLDALGLLPLITAGMYLGEGTGAVAALPLLDMAYAVYGEMPTFAEIEIESYRPLA